MTRRYTVIWLGYGNPCATRVTLPKLATPETFSYDDWLAHALVAHWRENGHERDLAHAREYIADHGPGLAAVIKGHAPLAWEP